MTRVLTTGGTVRLPVTRLLAVLRWTHEESSPPALSALFPGPGRRIRPEDTIVFRGRPRHPAGLVRWLPAAPGEKPASHGPSQALQISLARLDAADGPVVLAASAPAGVLARAGTPRLVLHDADGQDALAVFPFAPESTGDTAVVCGELNRSDSGWEFRASGRAFDGGPEGDPGAFRGPLPAPARPGAGSLPRPAAAGRAGAADPRRAEYGRPPAGDPDHFVLPPQGPQFLPSAEGAPPR
ncbi:hypothetical protein GCM10009716_09530 [Streptomyces sodiiphilus]|uniref:TerD domain-containing protein n=1 Tax=Streptomyces sodiiphilus TaxID=226217 RepID=A0ABN2NT16_9ACTN